MKIEKTETMIAFEDKIERELNVKTISELKELYKKISEYYKEKSDRV